jgi:hypothetical protein
VTPALSRPTTKLASLQHRSSRILPVETSIRAHRESARAISAFKAQDLIADNSTLSIAEYVAHREIASTSVLGRFVTPKLV